MVYFLISCCALKSAQQTIFIWHSGIVFDPTREVCYADRMRIRVPGNVSGLLPHVDGGSAERWLDPGYQKVYKEIFCGNWKQYNAFDGSHRTGKGAHTTSEEAVDAVQCLSESVPLLIGSFTDFPSSRSKRVPLPQRVNCVPYVSRVASFVSSRTR